MKRCIFYDTETTGIRTDKDLIVEIAAYDPVSKETFVSFVNPKVPIPEDASAIHHITDEMVKDAPDFSIVGKNFIEFCGENAVLVAHNNERFDKQIMHHEALRHEITWPQSWIHLDSLLWARRYRPDLPRHSLQVLREVYKVPANNAHRALDDVIVLAQVFSAMIGDLSIDQVVELLSTNKKMTHMPFGKHRGMAFSDIPKNYFDWLKASGALEKKENEELRDVLIAQGLLL